MATRTWVGGAPAVAQVTGYVFAGTWEASDVINIVIGTKTYSTTAGSTTTATVVSNLVTSWNALDADDYPEFAELTASAVSSTTFTLTGDTAGKPFTVTISTTETGGGAADAQTIDGAASSAGVDSVACSGPNFWSVAANWSGATVPVGGDTVYLQNSDDLIKYGLAQSGVTLTALYIDASFTGEVGLPIVNSDAAEYPEYRATFLAISATTFTVGQGAGQGSQRIKVDTGTVQTLLTVLTTSSPADQDLPAMLWKGTHASGAVNVYGGSLGAAVLGGEVATILTLRVQGGGVFVGGSGVTLTTLNQEGGDVVLGAGLTTVAKTGGALTVTSGNVTTLTDNGGTTRYSGVGTITTLNANGAIGFDGELRACTVTNTNVYPGASLFDPFGRVTWTNPIQLMRCDVPDVSLTLGKNRTLAIA